MRGGHIAIIAILTYVVRLGQFIHVIAGSVEALFLVMSDASGWGHWAAAYFLPTLLGNILGGVSLVSLHRWLQAAERLFVLHNQASPSAPCIRKVMGHVQSVGERICLRKLDYLRWC